MWQISRPHKSRMVRVWTGYMSPDSHMKTGKGSKKGSQYVLKYVQKSSKIKNVNYAIFLTDIVFKGPTIAL